ncbi:MAG: arylamine N-acetyltransferase [Chloroflexi bacterium]|nr:arylamine N-acetyltransferase [Chloroflexota bacterium]
MDIPSYLERIGYAGSTEPSVETLRAMHRAHAYAVPFENLDIGLRRRIQVDEAVNFAKIVGERRGGFCLELTGTFTRVLRELGFRVDVHGGRVMLDGRLSHPLSHMVLVVHLDEPWIADVGFGSRVIEPLRLAERGDQVVDGRRYVVANDGDHWFVTCNEPVLGVPGGNENAPALYMFTQQPREFGEFHEVCNWLQTSPDSRFTHGSIVSLPRPNGRTTLAGGRLFRVDDGIRTEQKVAPDEERSILEAEFGIVLAGAD